MLHLNFFLIVISLIFLLKIGFLKKGFVNWIEILFEFDCKLVHFFSDHQKFFFHLGSTFWFVILNIHAVSLINSNKISFVGVFFVVFILKFWSIELLSWYIFAYTPICLGKNRVSQAVPENQDLQDQEWVFRVLFGFYL